jgi:Tol biopolymer transport system component
MQQNADNIHQLTDSPGLDIEPSWSPDGTQIAFASNRESDTGLQIYLMKADGSEQQRLGPVQPGDNSHPSWSPDGSQIIFQSKRDTNGNVLDDNSDLFLMNADGSEITLLVFHSTEDTEPVWSPDGKYIAFISERSSRDEIYVMSPDGSNITQITDLNVSKTTLNWSGDSQSLAFEGSGDIYAVDVATKETTKIIGLRNSNESGPVWAQGKDHIIFSSDQTSNWNLYLADRSVVDQLILAPLTDGIDLNRSTSWFSCQ